MIGRYIGKLNSSISIITHHRWVITCGQFIIQLQTGLLMHHLAVKIKLLCCNTEMRRQVKLWISICLQLNWLWPEQVFKLLCINNILIYEHKGNKMILQTSRERYGEGFGFIFESDTKCVDIYFSRTPRLRFSRVDKDIIFSFLFFNLELTDYNSVVW